MPVERRLAGILGGKPDCRNLVAYRESFVPLFILLQSSSCILQLTNQPRSTSITDEKDCKALTRNDELVRMESC